MNILILSNSAIIREIIKNLIIKIYGDINIDIFDIDDYKKINEHKKYDLSICHIYNEKSNNIKNIFKLKDYSRYLMVLDQLKSESVLKLCMNNNVDGYVVDFEDEYEFKYIISKLLNGSKFYDSQVVYKLIGKMKSKDFKYIITDREK